MVTRVSVLGATGSIGQSTMKVLREAPGRFRVVALAAGRDVEGLAALAREMKPDFAAISDPSLGPRLAELLAGSGIPIGAGSTAVAEAAARPAEIVVAGISGIAGLVPTLAAFGPGRRVAVANKECLVAAGAYFMAEAARTGTELLPMDSEHNAVFQALAGAAAEDVERVTLTASGGPFRTATRAEIARATPKDALKHPNWAMGAKITIDSATLMNKGLELIEAHHLFGLSADRLEAVIHPESVIHGLVAYRDGAVVAGMALPDMCVPIAHCLGYPERLRTSCRRLDLAQIGQLTFAAPDLSRFPALGLAMAALDAGGGAATFLNAANEVAVPAFLEGRIGLLGIAAVVEETLARLPPAPAPATLDEALAYDVEARQVAAGVVASLSANAARG